MGGEGANWIGEAPFSTRGHIIQNLGDGTYNHSGVLAIRWAVAAGTNITFKILFNDAVAMTGGQQLEGGLTVDQDRRARSRPKARTKIVVVTDDANEISRRRRLAAGCRGPAARRSRSRPARTRRSRRARRSSSTIRPAPRKNAAAASAGNFPIPTSASSSTISSAKAAAIAASDLELRLGAAARNRIRPQARHRPVELQQGFLLPRRLLPGDGDGAWRQAESRRA